MLTLHELLVDVLGDARQPIECVTHAGDYDILLCDQHLARLPRRVDKVFICTMVILCLDLSAALEPRVAWSRQQLLALGRLCQRGPLAYPLDGLVVLHES